MTDRNMITETVLRKAVLDKLNEINNEQRAEVAAGLQPSERQPARLNGTNIGSVSMTDPKPAWKVTRSAAFLEWVMENHREAVHYEPKVDPVFEAKILKHGGLLDPVTGECELPPGVELVTAKPTMQVRPNKHAHALAENMILRTPELS